MRNTDTRPFARPLLAGRAAPFALAMVLALATLPLGGRAVHAVPAVGAVLLTASIAAAAWFVPWERLPTWVEAVPPLAWFGVTELLRASAGGSVTGYAPLVFLPVLWLMVYGTRRQTTVAIAGLAAALVTPLIVDGDPTVSDIRLVIMRALIAAVICATVLRVVRTMRRHAGELKRLASTDTLTGLPNRRVWEDALPRELARAGRSGAPVTVALLDLDDFKGYNDNYGHQGGDLLLKEVASSWRAELRDSDLLARYGGEEFALLLPDCGDAEVRLVVDKVRRAMPPDVTCSAGLAVWDGVEPAGELTRRADEALYAAKRGGRDRTVVAERGPQPHPAGA